MTAGYMPAICWMSPMWVHCAHSSSLDCSFTLQLNKFGNWYSLQFWTIWPHSKTLFVFMNIHIFCAQECIQIICWMRLRVRGVFSLACNHCNLDKLHPFCFMALSGVFFPNLLNRMQLQPLTYSGTHCLLGWNWQHCPICKLMCVVTVHLRFEGDTDRDPTRKGDKILFFFNQFRHLLQETLALLVNVSSLYIFAFCPASRIMKEWYDTVEPT